jgi:hypothetical protein
MPNIRGFVLAGFFATLLGCGDRPLPKPAGVSASGRIFLSSGAPLTGGVLVLRPVDGIHGVSSPIGNDGRFELVDSSGAKDVVPGKYRVYVMIPKPEQKSLNAAVPARYQSTEDGDSDVVVEIAGATNDLRIKLNR